MCATQGGPDGTFPVHFFTPVLNGEPFIRYHLDLFRSLPFAWHWHVVEGLAELPDDFAANGRSLDGTAEYLDQIAAEHAGNVTLYRNPQGRCWPSMAAMFAAPLQNIRHLCLLWQMNPDELWTAPQIETMRQMFLQRPASMAAAVYSHLFVGPSLAVSRWRGVLDRPRWRVWRYAPGMGWAYTNPPRLAMPTRDPNSFTDVTSRGAIPPAETERAALVYQHFAYVTPAQVSRKERCLGYTGLTQQWRTLQETTDFPVLLSSIIQWPIAHARGRVETAESCGILPLAHLVNGQWVLRPPVIPPDERDNYFSTWKRGYHLLPRVIEQFGLKVGVEVGVAHAGHAHAILQRTHVTRLYGVDSYRQRAGYEDPMNMAQSKFDLIYEKVLRLMKPHGDRFRMLRMDSMEAVQTIDEPLDFVYVDAEHSYEAVRRDLDAWYARIREGGVLSGHDFGTTNFPGVTRAVLEFADRQGLLIHTDEDFFWWTQKETAVPRPIVSVAPADAPAIDQKQGRGVIYVINHPGQIALLQRSIQSVRSVHPDLRIVVRELGTAQSVLEKSRILDWTPFQETLFLDADILVLGRLDFGFEMAQKHGLACCLAPTTWARRFPGISGDIPEYDTGAFFFSPVSADLFAAWKDLSPRIDSMCDYMSSDKIVSSLSDRAAFSMAVFRRPTPPFILPVNWNYRPNWASPPWGPIKIWHDAADPSAELQQWSYVQSLPNSPVARFQPRSNGS